MGKLGYDKMKKDKARKRAERVHAWTMMGAGTKILVVLGVLAAPFILTFALIIGLYTLDTGVPYTLKKAEKIDNPNGFNKNFVYSDFRLYGYSEMDEVAAINGAAKNLYNETGLQLYIVGQYAELDMKSDNEFIDKCNKFIAENINDEYGVYVLFSDYEDDRANPEHFIYLTGEKFILGDKADEFFTPDVWETYNRAYDKVRHHSFEYYNGIEEFLIIMDYIIDRNLHPYTAIAGLLFKWAIAVGVVVVVVKLIKKRKEKVRKDALVSASLDELVKEHEDLYGTDDIERYDGRRY